MARAKPGRPIVHDIDPALVLKFAQLNCKTTEIADYFGVSVDTIDRNYAEELTKGRGEIRMSLRQWQLNAAKAGNPTMLVWLGKQMLGQKDQHEIVADVEITHSTEVLDLKEKLLGLLNVDSK